MSWKKRNQKLRPRPRKFKHKCWRDFLQSGVRVDGTTFYYKDPRWPGRIEDTMYILEFDTGGSVRHLIEGADLIKGPVKGFKPMTEEEKGAWGKTFLSLKETHALAIDGLVDKEVK